MKDEIDEPPKTYWNGSDHVPYKATTYYDLYIQYKAAIQLKRIADLLEGVINDE